MIGRPRWFAGPLFLALAIAMTWPLVLHLSTAVTDPGDPLLNTWIMAWDEHALAAGSLRGFFDANIFFPNHRTLAYSEHLLPQALIGAVPLLLSGNPLLAYNVVVLLAFASSALGMYVLARHLIGSETAAVFAGTAFAFSPFMMGHLAHVQILSAAGLPLSFYFLHRFLARERSSDLLLLAVTMALQMLANGYYAVLLPWFIFPALILAGCTRKGPGKGLFIGKVLLLGAAIAVLTGPIFFQYALFRAETGFARRLAYGVTLGNYLSAPSCSVVWGRLTAPFWHGERNLFPGLLSLTLAVFGVVVTRRTFRRTIGPGDAGKRRPFAVAVMWLSRAAVACCVAAIVAIAAFGTIRFPLGLQGDSVNGPLLGLGLALAGRVAADPGFRRRAPGAVRRFDLPFALYGAVLIVAFLLCLGPRGPLALLYGHVPGFDAMRAVPRIHVFSTLALAVFAAFGVAELEKKSTARARRVLVPSLAALLLADLACVPLPLTRVETGSSIPPVYTWLAGQKGDDWGVAELPFPKDRESFGREIMRVYDSAWHWKRTMSGYSGYFPLLSWRLQPRWNPAPPTADLAELRELGLRFVLLHRDEMTADQFQMTEKAIAQLVPPARVVADVGGDRVYELDGWHPWRPATTPGHPISAAGLARSRASANVNEDLAKLAIDGDIATGWDSGPLSAGRYFQLDLGSEMRLDGLTLLLGDDEDGYPRGYDVDTSLDGEHWVRAGGDEMPALPLRTFLRPTRLGVDITFPSCSCRCLRITNRRTDAAARWTIREVEVWRQNSGDSQPRSARAR